MFKLLKASLVTGLLLSSGSVFSAEKVDYLEMKLGAQKLIADFYASKADERSMPSHNANDMNEKMSEVLIGEPDRTAQLIHKAWGQLTQTLNSVDKKGSVEVSSIVAIEEAKNEFFQNLSLLVMDLDNSQPETRKEALAEQSIRVARLLSLYSRLSLSFYKLTDTERDELLTIRNAVTKGMNDLKNKFPGEDVRKASTTWKFTKPVIKDDIEDQFMPFIVHRYGSNMIIAMVPPPEEEQDAVKGTLATNE